MIVKGISVIEANEYDEIADDVIDKLLKEIELEFGMKKKRKYNNYGDSKNKLKARASEDSDGKKRRSNKGKKKKGKGKKKKKGAAKGNKDGKDGKDGGDNDEDVDDDEEDEFEDEEEEYEDGDYNESMPVTPYMGDDMKDFDDHFDIDIDKLDENTEDFIDACFNELMKELSQRTRDLHKINENQDRELLLDAVKERHGVLKETLTKLNYDYVDEIPEMNKAWQDEIFVVIEELQNPKPQKKQDVEDIDDVLNRTLDARNSVLTKAIAVLNNEQPKALLDELVENGDTNDDQWMNILNDLNKMKNKEVPKDGGGQIDGSQMAVCNELVTEMQTREQDLESLRQLNENDMEPSEEVDNILEDVKTRHAMEMEKLNQIAGNDDGKEDGDDPSSQLLDNIQANNIKWEGDLTKLIELNKGNVANRKQNSYYADELNGRIADLLKLIDIFNATKSTKPDMKKLKNDFRSFVTSIKDRHQYNHENKTEDKDAKENDKDWKDNVFSLATNMSGLKVSDVMDGGDGVDDDTEENNADDEAKENDVFDPKNWWLNKDENRNDTIDEISIDEQV